MQVLCQLSKADWFGACTGIRHHIEAAEDLAEKTGLSANYIGMLERSEKIPSLETFIHIANALRISADMLLVDVLDTGYVVKNSLFSDKLSTLPASEREKIYAVIDTMIEHSFK